MHYIHGKDWVAKLLGALVTERMKPFIIKYCPTMQIGGIKDKFRTSECSKNMDEIKQNK